MGKDSTEGPRIDSFGPWAQKKNQGLKEQLAYDTTLEPSQVVEQM